MCVCVCVCVCVCARACREGGPHSQAIQAITCLQEVGRVQNGEFTGLNHRVLFRPTQEGCCHLEECSACPTWPQRDTGPCILQEEAMAWDFPVDVMAPWEQTSTCSPKNTVPQLMKH